MNTNSVPFIPVIVVVAVVVWLTALSILYFRALRHYTRLTKEIKGVDLKRILEEHLDRLGSVNHRVSDLEKETKNIRELSLGYVQKVAIVRFNPYDDTGGDQSFAVALLDAHGSGVVISSLHGRSGTRIYGKPVKDGAEVNHLFSEEEKRVIKKALGDEKNV